MVTYAVCSQCDMARICNARSAFCKIPHNNFTNEEVLWRTQLLAQCE
jgi:hypothetical protein